MQWKFPAEAGTRLVSICLPLHSSHFTSSVTSWRLHPYSECWVSAKAFAWCFAVWKYILSSVWKIRVISTVRCTGLCPHKRQDDRTVADGSAVYSSITIIQSSTLPLRDRQAQEWNELVCTSTLLMAFSNLSKHLEINFASSSQIHYGYVKYWAF